MLWKQVKASSHPDPQTGSYMITSKELRTTRRLFSSGQCVPSKFPVSKAVWLRLRYGICTTKQAPPFDKGRIWT